MKINKSILTIIVISGMLFLYSRCVNSSQTNIADLRGEAYAGSATCINCHKAVYNSYQHTNHATTSWPADSLPGKMITAVDSFAFDNNSVIKIEKRDSGIFQVLYTDGKESLAEHFETGFGSGDNASSFGYWKDKRLYQLPLSYFTTIHGWANSPGFPAHRANFQRPIIRRCFECHSSFIAEDAQQAESLTLVRQLDKNSLIYGIDCERCHGPAAAHVAFHSENPSTKEAKYIVKQGSLSRQQKLDECAVCHSGNDLKLSRSAFAFKPGDTLSKFYYPEFGGNNSGIVDVHGKQLQLLEASRCFIQTNSLECSSCHNVHDSKQKTLEDYSKSCLGCHQHTDHKDLFRNSGPGNMVNNNCIDCHMPKQASKMISFQVMGKEKVDSYLLRTHRIAVYPLR